MKRIIALLTVILCMLLITACSGTVKLTYDKNYNLVDEKNGMITIKNNGSIPKFVDEVTSISFSAKRARANKQKVLYVTERCVFELGEKGLRLIEVYPGVDIENDIIKLLPFEVEIEPSLLDELLFT